MFNKGSLLQNGISGYLYRILFIVLIPLAQMLYFFLNLTTTKAHDVTIFIDKITPFNSWFVIPYTFWYFFTFGMLLILAFKNYKLYYKLLASIVIGMLICLTIYSIFPTTVPRPQITPHNILDKLVLLIYSNDRPYNCFPSIHMLDTLLITLYMFKYYKKAVYRVTFPIICILIYLSTLFIKQHSLLDALASTVLGVALFCIFESNFIADKLMQLKDVIINSRKSKLGQNM